MSPPACTFYDDPEFDYQDYWASREYEDLAERAVLNYFYADFIGHQRRLVDIGAGYGRLLPLYAPWAQEVFVIEPSWKLNQQLKKIITKYPQVKLLQGNAENLCLKSQLVDVVQMIRVAHHCLDMDQVMAQVSQILKPGGWFIFEFPNKIHGLMTVKQYLQGHWTFRSDFQSVDRRAQENRGSQTIPFMNHHPQQVLKWMEKANFEVIKCCSISNLRRLKIIPIPVAVRLDRWFWNLTKPIWWGPSVFVLGRKRS